MNVVRLLIQQKAFDDRLVEHSTHDLDIEGSILLPKWTLCKEGNTSSSYATILRIIAKFLAVYK